MPQTGFPNRHKKGKEKSRFSTKPSGSDGRPAGAVYTRPEYVPPPVRVKGQTGAPATVTRRAVAPKPPRTPKPPRATVAPPRIDQAVKGLREKYSPKVQPAPEPPPAWKIAEHRGKSVDAEIHKGLVEAGKNPPLRMTEKLKDGVHSEKLPRGNPPKRPVTRREQVLLAKDVLRAKRAYRKTRGGRFTGEAKRIANELRKLGYSPKAAAGITGNAFQESSYNPGAVEPGTDNGGLWGFTAGEKSMASLRAFAEANGLDPSRVSTQVRFMDSTMPDDLRQRLNTAASPEDAALMFSREWERPGIPMEGNRTAAAGRVMAGLRAGSKRGNPRLKAKWLALVKEGREAGIYDRPLSTGTYPLGVKGKVIANARDHGARAFGNWMSDNALDIQVPAGTPVKAVVDGTISRVSGSAPNHAANPAGWTVYLKDRNGREFSYMHLDAYDVKAGQKVKAGQVLGKSGAANGVEHLHFAVDRGKPGGVLKESRNNDSPFVSFSPRGPGSSSIPNKLKPDSETTLTFQKPFAEALLRLASLSGEPISFNEARRTRARQQYLADNPSARSGPAAAPGTSNHEGGAAADVNLTPKQESLLAEAGLAKPVAGEPWHIELADRSKVMSPQEAYAAGIEQAEGEGSSLGLSAMGQVKADQRVRAAIASPSSASLAPVSSPVSGSVFTSGSGKDGKDNDPLELLRKLGFNVTASGVTGGTDLAVKAKLGDLKRKYARV